MDGTRVVGRTVGVGNNTVGVLVDVGVGVEVLVGVGVSVRVSVGVVVSVGVQVGGSAAFAAAKVAEVGEMATGGLKGLNAIRGLIKTSAYAKITTPVSVTKINVHVWKVSSELFCITTKYPRSILFPKSLYGEMRLILHGQIHLMDSTETLAFSVSVLA